jgi:hypothetical protein
MSIKLTDTQRVLAKGARFEHGSVLGGKTRSARVSSQWKSMRALCSEKLAHRMREDALVAGTHVIESDPQILSIIGSYSNAPIQ